MRVFLIAIVTALACGVAAVAATSGAASSDPSTGGAATHPDPTGLRFVSPATVRQEAIKDIRRRLRRADVPPGARRLKGAPPHSHLSGPGLRVDSKNFLDRGEVWAVPGSADAVLAWIDAHPPAGGKSKFRGAFGAHGKIVVHEVGFEWKPLPERVNSRTLFYAVGTAPDGRTILRLDSQAVWVLPHPPSEVIPPATTLEVLRKPEAGGKQTRQVVTDRGAIAGLAGRIDRLVPLQPVGFEECGPGIPEGLTEVTLIFRDATGATLAEAEQDVPEGWCSYMKVTIGGNEEPLLVGGGAMLEKQLPLLPHHP